MAETEENSEVRKTSSAKLDVYRHWMVTLRDIQWKMEGLEYDLECQRYESDVTQRLYDATEDEKERKHWQKQIARIHKAMATTEAELAKTQRQAAYCEAMIALIRGDLEAEGIDPDTCDLDEFAFNEEFNDEFYNDDDIPF